MPSPRVLHGKKRGVVPNNIKCLSEGKNCSYYLAATFLFLVLVLLNYNYVCTTYYFGYTAGWDGPLLSHIMYRQDWEPDHVPYTGIGPYYQSHFSPIFFILSLFSYVLPVSKIAYFGIIQGIFLGLFFIASYSFLYKYYLINKRITVIIGLALLAFVLALNGINIKVIWHHHFEHWIPIFIALFLCFWIQKQLLWASISFIVLLLIREDAGFHFFGLIFLTILYDYYKRKRLEGTLVVFCIIAFCYSIFALYIQKTFYPGDKAFFRVYFDPSNPFVHLNYSEILQRLKSLLLSRGCVVFPIIVQIFWAIISKRYHILIAVISNIPWIILHFIAKADGAISLNTYYSFSIAVLFFWPFFSFVYFDQSELNKKMKISILKWQGSIILISILISGGMLYKMVQVKSGVNINNVKLFQEELVHNKNAIKNLYITHNIIGLAPTLDWHEKNPSSSNSLNIAMSYFGDFGSTPLLEEISNLDLNYFYAINGTRIRISSNEDISNMGLFSNLITNNNKDLEMIFFPTIHDVPNNKGLVLKNIKPKAFTKKKMFFAQGNYCVSIKFDTFEKGDKVNFYVYDAKLQKVIFSDVITRDNLSNDYRWKTNFLLSDATIGSIIITPESGEKIIVKEFKFTML
jgi:hypothetical protein